MVGRMISGAIMILSLVLSSSYPDADPLQETVQSNMPEEEKLLLYWYTDCEALNVMLKGPTGVTLNEMLQ